MIGDARQVRGLYLFNNGSNFGSQDQQTCFNSIPISSDSEFMLWHLRLGHPNFQYLKQLLPKLFMNKLPKLFMNKSLYGLKQSPTAWFDRLTKAIKGYGYHLSQANHTLFYKHSSQGKIALLIVFVDDIIFTGDDVGEL